jgi:hypothetical protein
MADLYDTKTSSPQYGPARPRLVLRVGITGMRSLDAVRVKEALPSQLHSVLDLVRNEMVALAMDTAVADVYEGGGKKGPVPFELRFLSPLARGADRLAAKAAHDLGYKLFVPMPFPQAEYEEDFTVSKKPEEPGLSANGDLNEFKDLLELVDKDNRLELDGSRKEENRAYENVGRFVVRNSDLLIAIWDGDYAGGGPGGTGEIIRYAARVGVPVWWIHATKACEPVWIAAIQDLRELCCDTPPPEKKHKETCEKLLQSYLGKQIRPPPPVKRDCDGPIRWLARQFQARKASPEVVYFDESLPPLKRRDPPEDRAVADYWLDLYDPADALARKNAARYRGSYTWLFILATMALVLGAAAFLFHHVEPAPFVLAALEFLTLLVIATIIIAAIYCEWQECSIEYRLLAELCRKQRVLARLGRAVSLGTVRHMETPYRANWVAWLFAAFLRAAPLPCGVIAEETLSDIRDKDVLGENGLIGVQWRYHRDRYKRVKRKGTYFDLWAQRTFILVCLFVALKLAATWWHWDPGLALGAFAKLKDSREHCGWDLGLGLGFFAIVLAAGSAALVGYRSYAELQHLAEQSHYMKRELSVATARVKALNLACPMASQDLGDETFLVANLMLRDLEGWALLFGTKAIGP